ncbi:TonB-dependent receptor [Mucilaginibacter sp. UYCu711]|uniref:TonB-dependent receptor n=1 Tax=Mucilaginibacter sp. UYCu711 TaxID=3156339 RepID=UPI003D1E82C3
MRKYLLSLFIGLLTTGLAFAQGVAITGKLLDAQTKEPLIGATITIKGTTNATSASLDGTFKITAPSNSTLVITYIGYVTKEVSASGTKLGTILIDPVSGSLGEVVVSANRSLAIDRQTPIAVSTVGAKYIEEKGADAEFPELLKSTPGVTTSRGGGGYGDSRIAIRGFNSNNLALLINGLPVQDPEAGKIFWNDWAGLADVTTSMQVQRGLSASRVAVPSLGGTINITTKSLETQQGGTISQAIGSYNSLKTAFSYATGLTPSGWAASFLLSKSTGDGTAEGLYYTGYSYFANISKILSKNQTLSLNFMGASQSHGQRFTYQSIATYRAAPQGESRFNSDWGVLYGKTFSGEVNRYNKPLLSLNHDWKIDETASLSTILYASYGTGAAVYLAGSQAGLAPGGTAPRVGDFYSPIDFDAIVKTNKANADASSTTYINQAENDHYQYGLLSTFKKTIKDINLLAGVDLRGYKRHNFYVLNNLLGGQYWQDKIDLNSGTRNTVVGDKIGQNYDIDIFSEGVFAQAEYIKNAWSAFVTVGGNNTSNRKTDFFDYLTSNPARKSVWVNFLGFQVKGGANYNIDAHNNVFVNIGTVQKPPLVATVFPTAKTTGVNPTTTLEKLFSYELGYGYTSAIFSANVNLYHSQYNDRSKVLVGLPNQDGSIPYGNINGINELHQGIEIDAKLRPVKGLTLSGMLSLGDYKYTSNSGDGLISSDKPGAAVTVIKPLPLKGLVIGDFGGSAASNAQTSAALGLDVDVLPSVRIGGNWNYYTRFFASYDMSKFNNGTNTVTFTNPYHPIQLPNYSTIDLNVVYRFKFAGLNASFIGNVHNLLDAMYLSEALDSTPSSVDNYATQLSKLGVNYGAGRIYSTTLKINF